MTERKKQGKQHVLFSLCRPNLHPRVVEIAYSGYMRRDLKRLGTCDTWLWRHTACSSYLFLQYDMLPLPVLHHAQCLKSAYNVVRVDGHLLTDVCKTKIFHLNKYQTYKSVRSVQESSNVFPSTTFYHLYKVKVPRISSLQSEVQKKERSPLLEGVP